MVLTLNQPHTSKFYIFNPKIFSADDGQYIISSCTTIIQRSYEKYNIVIIYLGFKPFNPPFPHTTILQQTTLNIICQKMENLYNWMDNLWLKVEKWKTLWQKEKLLVLSNFFFCHYVFKDPSAAGASFWHISNEQFLILSQCF